MVRARHRDIVVIGTSAGGIAALNKLLGGLREGFPACVLVVMHQAPDSPGMLPEILGRSSALPVVVGGDGNRLEPGRVVVAPPDHHLYLEGDHQRLSRGARENGMRPSIDVLFRSAAVAAGPRVVGVILTGMLDDGAAGLWAIKRRGGVAIVQDPAEAEAPELPRNVMQVTAVDHCSRLEGIVEHLNAYAGQPVLAPYEAAPEGMKSEVEMATSKSDMETLDRLGRRTPLTCPECGGTMWEISDAGGQRFRCHVGHAYSAQSMAAGQSTRVESALWAALRTLEETERLSRRLAQRLAESGSARAADYHMDRVVVMGEHARVLRKMLQEASAPEVEEEAPAQPRAV